MEGDHTLPAGTAAPSGQIEVGAQAGGRYKILRYIAAGAMGEVYAAEDLIIGTTIALKVLRAELQSSSTALARLRREIALARQVTDVHICRVHDVGEHAGRVFLTMELLEGKTLGDHAGGAPLAIAEVERIARQLIAGLAALHRAGIVHRDFKTANTMVVGQRVVITDFGLARSLASESDGQLTGEAAVLGTPAYMAPEQVEGKPATTASDIYALGVVLFELLTGKRPFAGDSAMGIAAARLTKDPPRPSTIRPDVPARWDAIVLRCLARDPAARFARVEDVLGEPTAPRRSRMPLVAGGLGALAIAGVATYVLTRDPETRPIVDIPTKPEVPALRERQLTSFEGRGFVSTVALSRDGTRIAYQAGELWIRDLSASEAQRIELPDVAGLRVLDWFPDGQRLLVRTQVDATFTVQILDLRDRTLVTVRSGPQYAWLSPTADRIAYFGADGVSVGPISGAGDRVIYPGGKDAYQLAWSHDGAWIAAAIRGTQGSHIEVIATDGSRTTTLPRSIGTFSTNSGLVWAKDRLLYARVGDLDRTEVCSVGVIKGAWDGVAPRCVWNAGTAELDWMGFAGGRLVFVKNTTTTTVETIALDADGKPRDGRSPLPGQQGHTWIMGFTKDGRLLLGSARRGEPSRILTQRPEEPVSRVISRPVKDALDDLAVADGDAFGFTRASTNRCEVIRHRGDREDVVLSEPRDGQAGCPFLRCSTTTPGRCMLIRVTAGGYVFRRFDLATGKPHGPERRRPGRNSTVDISPDGSTLVWGIEGKGVTPGLALLELDTDTYREIKPVGTFGPHDASWFDDNSWVVSGVDLATLTQQVVRMRSDGSVEALVTDRRAVQIHNPYRSPDGKVLAMFVLYTGTDVFALEGFE